MLDSRYTGVALSQDCAALGVDHILCNGVDDGFAFQVDTLDLIACILWCRVECHRQVQSCMQSFSEEGETAFECLLLHLNIYDLRNYDLLFFSSSISRCSWAIWRYMSGSLA